MPFLSFLLDLGLWRIAWLLVICAGGGLCGGVLLWAGTWYVLRGVRLGLWQCVRAYVEGGILAGAAALLLLLMGSTHPVTMIVTIYAAALAAIAIQWSVIASRLSLPWRRAAAAWLPTAGQTLVTAPAALLVMLPELWPMWKLLVWWVAPALIAAAAGVFFGGGALAWVGARFVAGARRATYWRSAVANALSVWYALGVGAMAAGLAVIVALVVLALVSAEPSEDALRMVLTLAAVAGVIVAVLTARATMVTVLRLRHVEVSWLSAAGQAVALVVLLGAAGYASAQRTPDALDRRACRQRLLAIGQARKRYVLQHGGVMRMRRLGEDPPGLKALLEEELITPECLKCPAADGSHETDYFLHTIHEMSGEDMLGCDFWLNHGGVGRHVLFANGQVRWMTESEFQDELRQPQNWDFANALREAGRSL